MQAYYYVDPRDGKIYSTLQDRGIIYEVKQHSSFDELLLVNPKSGELVEQVVAWESLDKLHSAITTESLK